MTKEIKKYYAPIKVELDMEQLQLLIDARVELAVREHVKTMYKNIDINIKQSIQYLKKRGYKASYGKIRLGIESASLPVKMGNLLNVEALDLWAFQNLKTIK